MTLKTKTIRSFVKFCLILLAGSIPAACSDKADESPEYKTPEGLHFTTNAEYSGTIYLSGRETLSAIIFYSDIFPVLTLKNAKITIYSQSGTEILLAKRGSLNSTPSISLDLADESFFPTVKSPGISGFPDCSTNGHMFWIYFCLPEKMGHYDCYFRIEDPSQNIYLETPIYRLSLSPHGEEPTDWYTTNIEVLKK